jgi:hypothetical protein
MQTPILKDSPMSQNVHARWIKITLLLLGMVASSSHAAPAAAPTSASGAAPATIESITQLSRQKVAETLKTEVLVTRAAGVKAERESLGLSAPPPGTALTGPAAAFAAPQRAPKPPKDEFMTLPSVLSISGTGQNLKATLSNGRNIVSGDAFAMGNANVTVESLSKDMVVFKRCVKSDCTRTMSKVTGY